MLKGLFLFIFRYRMTRSGSLVMSGWVMTTSKPTPSFRTSQTSRSRESFHNSKTHCQSLPWLLRSSFHPPLRKPNKRPLSWPMAAMVAEMTVPVATTTVCHQGVPQHTLPPYPSHQTTCFVGPRLPGTTLFITDRYCTRIYQNNFRTEFPISPGVGFECLCK